MESVPQCRRRLLAVVLAVVATALAGCASSFRAPIAPAKVLPDIIKPGSPEEVERTPPGPGGIVVQPGDTVFSIAQAHGVPVRGLIDANRLVPPYQIRPGDRLVLPHPSVHVVGKDDTIYGIARRYGIDMGELVRINGIPPPYRIAPGDRLRLPDAGAPAVQVASRTPAPPPTPPAAPEPTSPLAATSPPPPRAGDRFLWPVHGKVIMGFGNRGGLHNDGINIAVRAGTPVHAAENGVVAYAGNQLAGFGNLVLIRHADGWMTAYAHISVLLVRRGQVVRRGDVIARVGNTGNVIRPQLHFELRKGDEAVDPLAHMMRTAQRAAPLTTAVFPGDPQDPG